VKGVREAQKCEALLEECDVWLPKNVARKGAKNILAGARGYKHVTPPE